MKKRRKHLSKQVPISREEFVEFFTKNYCDIEKAGLLPKEVGSFPSSKRLLTIQQLDKLISKARRFKGETFALFVELKVGGNGGTVPLGNNRHHKVVFLDFDNWNLFYEEWKGFTQEVSELERFKSNEVNPNENIFCDYGDDD